MHQLSSGAGFGPIDAYEVESLRSLLLEASTQQAEVR